MKKILFMPFLQLPSGHHQVADAIIESLTSLDPSLTCQKVDILHYSYGKIETFVSSIYLKWIHRFPKTYSWIYKKSVFQDIERDKDYRLYEILFKQFVQKLVSETNPALIICSHALPSYMLNKLKEKKLLNIPVVNVYTDFFIHTFWGISHIDYHFIAHPEMKSYLKKKGISDEKIHVTGIPVHPCLRKNNKTKPSVETDKTYTCTIMGGSLGVGAIEELIGILLQSKRITYQILCGKNRRLFAKLKSLDHPRITPLPYISCRDEMNTLYEQTDFVITKPGGVTISECLMKRIPTFIYHALPGQEEINLQELLRMGLVVKLPHWGEIADLEGLLLTEVKRLDKLYQNIDVFHNHLSQQTAGEIVHKIINERSLPNEKRA
ncbi:MGDG synthase family glycosyltransferase [Ferdinandcohnia sp. Marseille-Q9671]